MMNLMSGMSLDELEYGDADYIVDRDQRIFSTGCAGMPKPPSADCGNVNLMQCRRGTAPNERLLLRQEGLETLSE